MNEIELKVLIIDDEKENMQPFTAKARNKRISLNHFSNFEDGLNELKENFLDYNGVILDARCFADKRAEKDNIISDAYIDRISDDVKELSEQKGYIPQCIYTGYSATFKERLELRGYKVFAKPQENDDVFDYIREQNSIENKYYFAHQEVMNLFREKILNPKYLNRLSKCFDRLDSIDPDDIRATATTVREVMEDFYKRLEYLDIIPTEFVYRDLNPTNCSKYLVGNIEDGNGEKISDKYKADQYVGWLLTSVHNSTSKYSHNNVSTDSQYIQKAMIFSLLEVLDWFDKKFVKKTI
jgi:ActR/RegA family two-component response regulator